MSRCNGPGPVPKASAITCVSGSFSKGPACLLLGQAQGPPGDSDPGTALRELPVWGQEKPRPGQSSCMCSMHRPWEMTEEVSQEGLDAGTPRKTPAGGTPQAALAGMQRSTEPGIGLSSAIYQLCDLRCSSTSLCLSYLISKMEII